MSPHTITHLRKRDLVQVMCGSEKGKTGKILRVIQKTGRIVIEKINLVKRHTKATGKSPAGIIEKEAPLSASNVLLYCEKCGKGIRTKVRVTDAHKRVRLCKKCGVQLDK